MKIFSLSLKGEYWNTKRYREYYQSVPNLIELITSPLLLRIVTEAVPTLLETHPQNSNRRITRHNIYHAFITEWFKREVKRLKSTSEALDQFNWLEEFFWFAETLSFTMFLHKGSDVQYIPNSRYYSTAPSPWHDFFGKQDEVTRHARAACPLKRMRDHCYSFIHKSFMEYFAANYLYKTMAFDADDASFQNAVTELHQKPLGKDLLTREPAIIHFLSERIVNEQDKQRWLKVVRYSKKEIGNPDSSKSRPIKELPPAEQAGEKKKQNTIKTAAANAITVLNYANISFSGEDLSDVRIKSADLSQGIFHQTTLQRANLKNVIFHQATLLEANLRNAKMKGVVFGERAYLQHPNPKFHNSITSFACNYDDHQLAVAYSGGNIGIYDSKNREWLKFIDQENNAYIRINFLIYNPKKLQLAYLQDKPVIVIYDLKTFCHRLLNYQIEQDIDSYDANTISCLAYHPGGTQLASGSFDRTVRLWEIENGRCIQTLRGHTDRIYCLTYHPSGTHLASAGADQTIYIWDAKTGKCLQTLQGHKNRINCLVYHPQGMQLIAGGEDKTICFWGKEQQRNFYTLLNKKEVNCSVHNLVCHPLGSQLAFTNMASLNLSREKCIIYLYNLVNDSIHELSRDECSTSCLVYHPKSSQLISSSNTVLCFWRTEKWQTPKQRLFPMARSFCIYISPYFIFADGAGIFELWDMRVNQLKKAVAFPVNTSMDYVSCVAFNGTQIAWVDTKACLYYCNILQDGSKQILAGQGHSNLITSLVYSPLNMQLASGSYDKTVCLWDLKMSKLLRKLPEYDHEIICLAYNQTGTQLAVAAGYTFTVIYFEDLQTNTRFAQKSITNNLVNCLAYHPNQRQLACGALSNTVYLISLEQEQEMKILDGNKKSYEEPKDSAVICIAYILQGNYLIAFARNGVVTLWDTQNKTLINQHELYSASSIPLRRVIYDEHFLLTIDDFYEMNYWSASTSFDSLDPKLPNWLLKWTTCPTLSVTKMDFTNVAGLNPEDKTLLKQRGAVGNKHNIV